MIYTSTPYITLLPCRPGSAGEHNEARRNRNSKFRVDCWEEEEAPASGAVRRRRASPGGPARGRGASPGGLGRGRGGSPGGPCLWEASYYLGV